MKKTGKSLLSIVLTLLLAALPLMSIPALAVIVAPENVRWVTVPTSDDGSEPAGLNPGDPWLDLTCFTQGTSMTAAQVAAWLAQNHGYVWQFDFDLNYVRVDHNDGTEEIFDRQSGWIMGIRESGVQPVKVFQNLAGAQVGDYYMDMDGFCNTLYALYTQNGYPDITLNDVKGMYPAFTYRFNPTGNICRWQMQGAALPVGYTGGMYLPQYAIHAGGDIGRQMLWMSIAADANVRQVTAADLANSPWVPIPTSPNMLAVGSYYLDFTAVSGLTQADITELNGGTWYVDHAQGLVTGWVTVTENDPTLGTYTVEEQIPENADFYAAVVQKTGNIFASGYCGGEGDGTNLRWELTFDGVLTISGRGRMADYDYWDNTGANTPPWKFEIGGTPYRLLGYSSLSELSAAQTQPTYAEMRAAVRQNYALEQRVVIDEGVTYVGEDAFRNWMGYSVSLPSSLTAVGEAAFCDMAFCKQLTLPDALQDIGANAFSSPGICRITIPAGASNVGSAAFRFVTGDITVSGEHAQLETYGLNVEGWTDAASAPAVMPTEDPDHAVLTDLLGCYIQMIYAKTLLADLPQTYINMFGSAENARDYLLLTMIEWNIPTLSRYGISGETPDAIIPQLIAAFNAELGTAFSADDTLVTYDIQTDEITYSEAFVAAVGANEADDEQQTDAETIELGELPEGFIAAPWNMITVSCTDTWNGRPIAEVAEENDWGFFYVQHSFDGGEITTPPTCGAAGERTYTCADCGQTVAVPEPATGLHQHVQEVAETAATATAHGYTAGVRCTDCGAWLSGHEVIHNTLGARTVLRDPTEEEEGEAVIVCTVCGERGLYAIEKLPHTEQQDNGGDNDGLIARVRKAIKSFVDWVLRLIKWLGMK